MKPQGRLRDAARCPIDTHGCPAGAHPVMGPAIQGSADVLVNGRPALRDGDRGIHYLCCGSNSWKADGGSEEPVTSEEPDSAQGQSESGSGDEFDDSVPGGDSEALDEPCKECEVARGESLEVTCEHEFDGHARLFETAAMIELVPDVSDNEDTVEFLHEDLEHDSPDVIEVYRSSSVIEAHRAAGADGKASYSATLRYEGDRVLHPFSITYWRNFCTPTRYNIEGFSRYYQALVFNPDKWKIAVSFPPLRKISGGAKR